MGRSCPHPDSVCLLLTSGPPLSHQPLRRFCPSSRVPALRGLRTWLQVALAVRDQVVPAQVLAPAQAPVRERVPVPGLVLVPALALAPVQALDPVPGLVLDPARLALPLVLPSPPPSLARCCFSPWVCPASASSANCAIAPSATRTNSALNGTRDSAHLSLFAVILSEAKNLSSPFVRARLLQFAEKGSDFKTICRPRLSRPVRTTQSSPPRNPACAFCMLGMFQRWEKEQTGPSPSARGAFSATLVSSGHGFIRALRGKFIGGFNP
jgi:hypothetical protein